MENAGRTLARHVLDVRATANADGEADAIVVAGNGGNRSGGPAAARHLADNDVAVRVPLDRSPAELTGTAAHQHAILERMAVPIQFDLDAVWRPGPPATVVDAHLGYGLHGPVRGTALDYVDWMAGRTGPVVSLDVPTGVDATSGDVGGSAGPPDSTLSLALPRVDLRRS